MSSNQKEFLEKLLAIFRTEAQEHISALSTGLIELEKAPAGEESMKIVETVFREAHSLKGAARAVNMPDIESLCQSLESVFCALKSKMISAPVELFDLLHRGVDHLGKILTATEAELNGAENLQLSGLLQNLNEAAGGKLTLAGQVESEMVEGKLPGTISLDSSRLVAEVKQSPAETVRVTTAKLTRILLQVEEMLSAKLAMQQRVAELYDINSVLKTWDKEWARIHPAVQNCRHLLEKKGDQAGDGNTGFELTRLIEFLDWNHAHVKFLENRLRALTISTEHEHHALEAMVGNLVESSKKVLMTPFSALLEIIPKFVRDLSRDQGKEVKLVILGGEVEADRRIVEEMKDPLIHLVRNCIDHGIEKSEERERKKKPLPGEIKISITQQNNHLEILVADDGPGIEVSKIRAEAVRVGLLSPEEAEGLVESEALSLIFQSGISTSRIITNISGRGLGLAIVREKVDKLGGRVSFETHADVGTTFQVILPLTMTTFRGIIVRLGDHLFVIPVVYVERVIRVSTGDIKTVENRETIESGGKAVSLVNLADVLEIPRKSTVAAITDSQAIILTDAGKRIAYLVTEVLNEQEVLVKSLGKQLSRVRNIAGAAILGTGKVIPILNVLDLMKSSVRSSRAAVFKEVPAQGKKEEKQLSVLVVEDSITARTLLKNILEAAGFRVTTAVDGIDAFTQLCTAEFDIVVSDVDMPRMNGFDLTKKIRGDKKLADMPVVLVTALESRADRERGVEAGANAYIVKSRFDQSDLLETIRRLI